MSDQDQNQREHEDLNVWILGSSIGSLASAVFLIRDAEIPAPQIHLFESRGAPEDGLPTTGDAVSGYDHRSSCLPIVRDKYTEHLLSLVPSIACSEQSALDNLKSFKGDVAATRLLFQGDNHLEAIDPNNFSIGWKIWMSLMNFGLKSEKSLDRKVICDCFKAKFFSSAFWITWSSTLVSHRRFSKSLLILAGIKDLVSVPGLALLNSVDAYRDSFTIDDLITNPVLLIALLATRKKISFCQ